MESLTWTWGLTDAASSPLTTGDPLGDVTSYGIFSLVIAAGWRLFRWWRQDQLDSEDSHDQQMARAARNQTLLIAHITRLSVEVARLGGDPPPMPDLEQ